MGRNWQISLTYKGLKIGTLTLKKKSPQVRRLYVPTDDTTVIQRDCGLL